MFDVTNRASFESVSKWHKLLRSNSSNNMMVILVGNKVDLKSQRVVSNSEGKAAAKSMRMEYAETSAKIHKSISNVFERLTELILKKICSNLIVPQNELGIKLRNQRSLRDKLMEAKNSYCCI